MAKRGLQPSLNDFLIKKTKSSAEKEANCRHTADSLLHADFQTEINQITSSSSTNVHELDIAFAFDKKLNDDLKYKLLTPVWNSDKNYKFPI